LLQNGYSLAKMDYPTEALIQQAISAARSGDQQTAYTLLSQVVEQEPQNARAWYLLSQVSATEAQAVDCLQRVLQIQPGNAQAVEQLEKIQARRRALEADSPGSSKGMKKSRVWLLFGMGVAAAILFLISIYLLIGGRSTAEPVAVVPLPAQPQQSPSPENSAAASPPATFTPVFTSTLTDMPGMDASLPVMPSPAISPEIPFVTPAVVPITTSIPLSTSALGLTRVIFIDAGKGDSTLVQTPDGKFVLIDGGDVDSGVALFLQNYGVKNIDVVIATNPHPEHIGGLVEVLKSFPVKKVVTNGKALTTPVYQQFLDEISAAATPIVEVKRGDTFSEGDVRFQVLNPAGNTGADMDENSLVLQLIYGNTTFLLMSDAGKEAEASMLAAGLALKANILKVGQHGSQSASTPAFLSAVQPAVAIYSPGADLPAPGTMAMLKAAGAQVYGTDKNGTLMVMVDASGYNIDTSRAEATATPGKSLPALPPPVTGIEVIALTNPVSRGEEISLTIRTSPHAACTIQVIYKGGRTDINGPEDKRADADGLVTWAWKISRTIPAGTWHILVTATLGGEPYFKEIYFTVK
jgi:competence protein ComEC